MSSEYSFKHKHIFGIEQMSPEDIAYILDTAESFKEISERPIKKVPTLRGKTVKPFSRTINSYETIFRSCW